MNDKQLTQQAKKLIAKRKTPEVMLKTADLRESQNMHKSAKAMRLLASKMQQLMAAN